MSRVAAAIVVFVVAFAGCKTCDSPYDYCGPVVDSDYHPAGPRAGSPGTGLIGTPIVGETIPSPPPSPPSRPRQDVRPEMPPAGGDLPGPSVMSRPRYSR